MLAQDIPVIVRTILAATVGMIDAALGRCPECDGDLQRSDRQIAFHSVTNGPADQSARMQIQDYSDLGAMLNL